MALVIDRSLKSPTAGPLRQTAFLSLSILFAVTIGLLCGNGYERPALLISAYAAIAAILRRKPESLAVCWLALSPLASCYLRYPLEQSLVTFDRVIVIILVLALAARTTLEKDRSTNFGGFELCWLLFTGYAIADSIGRGALSPASLKIAVDAFLL